MVKAGYLLLTKGYSSREEFTQRMKVFGCNEVVITSLDKALSGIWECWTFLGLWREHKARIIRIREKNKKERSKSVLTPTAVNQQKSFIEYLGFKDYNRLLGHGQPDLLDGRLHKIDLGIVKYHFYNDVGKDNFE